MQRMLVRIKTDQISVIAQEPDRLIRNLSIRQWMDARRFADVYPGIYPSGYGWFVRCEDREYGPFPDREAALEWEWQLAKQRGAHT